MLWVLCWVLACGLLHAVTGQSTEDSVFWYHEAEGELKAALQLEPNRNTARNVIVFIGDGLGIPTVTAARIYQGQQHGKNGEEGLLYFETFPHVALSKEVAHSPRAGVGFAYVLGHHYPADGHIFRIPSVFSTYNVDRQVADSAGTATALWCGYKGNYETIGVDARVSAYQCQAAKNPRHSRPCVLEWAQQAHKDTGIVTNTRITHATPAALYAKSGHRDWESDSKLGTAGKGCVDIARQLVENAPGKHVKVLFGGGRQSMIANLNNTRFSPETPDVGSRQDGRDLTQQWLMEKRRLGLSAEFVATTSELRAVNLRKTDYLMGLFGNDHMPYEDQRDKGLSGTPSLTEMVETAIEMLSKGDNGFFLAVEGGRIDHAHHDTKARRSLSETLEFDAAVRRAREMTSAEDTLIVVTADHSHAMSIQGYPVRGKDILGAWEKSDDGLLYTTLYYANGPNSNDTWNGTHVVRQDLSGVDTTHWEYEMPAGIRKAVETHGGEDVAIFASGPWSHLFHGVHEQSYIPHVISHAARIGPRADCTMLGLRHGCANSAASSPPRHQVAMVAALVAVLALTR